MKLGKVLGPVVSSIKKGNIDGLKIYAVVELDENLETGKKIQACVDGVGASVGDIVMCCTSSSARKTSLTSNVCTDNTIVAIVDYISSEKTDLYERG